MGIIFQLRVVTGRETSEPDSQVVLPYKNNRGHSSTRLPLKGATSAGPWPARLCYRHTKASLSPHDRLTCSLCCAHSLADAAFPVLDAAFLAREKAKADAEYYTAQKLADSNKVSTSKLVRK